MHFLALAITALAGSTFAAPASDIGSRACTMGTIKVRTDYNTAFIVRDRH
jgi:hypothetical protein